MISDQLPSGPGVGAAHPNAAATARARLNSAALTILLTALCGCKPTEVAPEPSVDPGAAGDPIGEQEAPTSEGTDRPAASSTFCCRPDTRECFKMLHEEARFACTDLDGIMVECPDEPACDWESRSCGCGD
jgi:hypothetical protein